MITSLLLAVVSIASGVYIYKYPPKKPARLSEKICMDYSHEKGSELNLSLIHEMVNGYKKNQLAKINNGLDLNDAHSIWFDLETLKSFVYHVETNAKQNNVSSKQLGLRIYYSRYPSIKTWKKPFSDLSLFLADPITKQYEKLHTLVMIPTIKNANNVAMDFNPKDKNTYKNGLPKVQGDINPKTRIPALSGINPTTLTNNLVAKTTVLSQNHGSLIPPADDPGVSF
ncbi:hypothetical protein [Tenacibaculum maritimum]|uniref:hypothetical protein n=1 Tax=Tenacibaculum maritimum TaxID=107401 RepID=UPI0012E4D8A7|nr:hypothetical protein [Tenacibaculum maritimum]MDB0600048.1 hypothetical protein [Tenacibaculum maritimum]MDB0610693.1 hypothetical protein [Tenacibaculum maritimum]CAA0242136.1 conserved hypothetical protein [Tenacibaculum maritimum]